MHIEVCHGLSTDSCLLAIQRFIARRGVPSSFESDNGTNFVGAARELREFASLLKNDTSFHSNLAERSCHWKFNPPASHFGGARERLVRGCKKAMFAVLSSRRLTEETRSTTMCLVEQILNARPLTAISSNPQDLEALTPNHFLLNRSTVFLPVGLTLPSDFSHRRVFKQARSHVDWVWKRWLSDYVPQLQRRSKWVSDSSCPLIVGSLVWIVDTDNPRGSYPLALVDKLHLGDDGRVRSAILKTKSGSLVRPLVKLVPLPDIGSCDQERGPGRSGRELN